MALSSFVLAKIASLPLMLLYAFIGASTGALLGQGKSQEEFEKIEANQSLILSGIALSFVMIAGITHNIKRELNKVGKISYVRSPGNLELCHFLTLFSLFVCLFGEFFSQILERQKKHKPGETDQSMDPHVDDVSAVEESVMEMGKTAPRQRRNV